MVQIRKTKQFEKMEEKYLKKLDGKQKEIYNKNLNLFKAGGNDNIFLLRLHPLKKPWLGYHSFTCLRNAGRDDRIIFKVIEGDETNYATVELVEFELIGDHSIYD